MANVHKIAEDCWQVKSTTTLPKFMVSTVKCNQEQDIVLDVELDIVLVFTEAKPQSI